MAEVATACPFSLLSQPLQGPLKSKNTTGKITAQSNKKESEVFPISACVTMSYTMGDSWKWIKLWSYPSRWAHSCRRASLDTSCRQPQKSVRLLPSHSGFTGPPPQPAWAQHSPAEPLGPSTHKTSHTHHTGPAPHMLSLDQDPLPQECWSRQSLGHKGWKREGDVGRSGPRSQRKLPGLNNWQHSSPQRPSTQFKCSAK